MTEEEYSHKLTNENKLVFFHLWLQGTPTEVMIVKGDNISFTD